MPVQGHLSARNRECIKTTDIDLSTESLDFITKHFLNFPHILLTGYKEIDFALQKQKSSVGPGPDPGPSS